MTPIPAFILVAYAIFATIMWVRKWGQLSTYKDAMGRKLELTEKMLASAHDKNDRLNAMRDQMRNVCDGVVKP